MNIKAVPRTQVKEFIVKCKERNMSDEDTDIVKKMLREAFNQCPYAGFLYMRDLEKIADFVVEKYPKKGKRNK